MVSTDKKTGGVVTRSVESRNKRQHSADERDVGTALRAAYQQAVDEKVPSDLLDLLGKLS